MTEAIEYFVQLSRPLEFDQAFSSFACRHNDSMEVISEVDAAARHQLAARTA